MSRWRFRFVYLVILPAITVAAGVLGYFSWRTASQFARLGEETIAQSTLLIVNEKVDQVEQELIAADNAIFELVDISDPSTLSANWLSVAEDRTPSVRSVLVLDDSGNPLAYAHRGSSASRRDFEKAFFEEIVADLELERQRPGRLKHLHQTYDSQSVLIATKAIRYRGHRRYIVVHHDTGWIADEQFPSLFATEEGKRLYNVVDENNRRVYGESLARAGDYLVGRRFPTTLYQWRLQVAPKQAPLLEAEGRSRRLNEVALIVMAFLVILMGMGFLLYAADKERRLSALKAEFVANVSHELKTPLSVVRMFGELLLTKRVRTEEKQQQYLEIICRESERLTFLIENVLDFAALERGKRKYAFESKDIGDVVRRAIDTFRYRLETQGQGVELLLEPDVPEIAIDEQAVLLAVINLLDNAVKYGGDAEVVVRVSATDRAVSIAVRDRGPGIPSDEQRKVFERFYRAKRSDGPRGSGIGLALVKQIAEAHGGTAWAENSEEGGAVVGFTLARSKRATELTKTVEPRIAPRTAGVE